MKDELTLEILWIHPEVYFSQKRMTPEAVEKKLEGINKSIADLAKMGKVEVRISAHSTEPAND